ncbi:MAG: nonstructural protein [Microvirus sp.]|nr:MAG: nonstructural protein [Microvirus sp.]
MSVLQIVAIYDIATEAYGRPVFVPALGAAMRGFADEINSNKDADVYKHPNDFALYHFGEWDDNSGEIRLLDKPARLAKAADLKEMTS